MPPGLIDEILNSLLKMAFPVAILSAALVWWAIRQGYLQGNGGVRGIDQEMKALSNERKRLKKEKERVKKGKAPEPEQPLKPRKFDPVQEKWMKFGGGYYGVVAFYTYLLIEWAEITDFITRFGGFIEMLKRAGIGTLIEFLINSLVNFIAAIAWPFYWISSARTEYFWVWFIAAYIGYRVGVRAILYAREQGWGNGWFAPGGDAAHESENNPPE
jgi:hypothetical protein